MKITAVQTIAFGATDVTNWHFVRIDTDEGLSGIGEASIGNDRQFRAAVAELETKLMGADPTHISALTRQSYAAPGGRIHYATLSAIEQALWDITGKALGVPVYRLLGGAANQRIPLYANINRGTTDRAPSGFATRARRAVADGFKAVKLAPFDRVKPGDMASQEGRSLVEHGLARVFAVRDEIGPDVALMVDCHWRFTLAEALEIARELAPCRPFWIEDLISDPDVQPWLRFRGMRPERVAGGERKIGLGEFLPFITAGAWDVVCPDVKYCGGIVELQRIAAVAEASNLPLAPHNPTGPVGTLASAHACASVGNLAFLEFQYDESPWRNELVNGAERIVDGYIELPDTPGIGCELSTDVLAAHPPGEDQAFANRIGLSNA